MRSRNNSLWGILFVLVAYVFFGFAEANTLFSIDSHKPAAVRVYSIDGYALTNPVTISEQSIDDGPVAIASSEDLGLDLVISSCYNKFILLSAKTLGIRETFERERSES